MKKVNLDVQKIITLYKEGLSCKKIGDILGVSYPTIAGRLRKEGIVIRNLRDAHLIKKFNENFFDIIDNEAKAYWLGFLYADGNVRINVHKRGYKSYITSLSQMEIEPLEKFINSISGTDIKISNWITNVNTISYNISLNSKIMFDGLCKYGCIPNKSLILEFPSNIPIELHNHFIRGYFDGDGSIYKSNSKVKFKNHTVIYSDGSASICGTLEFLKVLKDNLIFMGEKGIYKEKRRVTNTWNLRVSGNKRCILLYDYLYSNATIFLQRKKDKFEQIINERGSTTIIGSPFRTPSHLVTNRRIRRIKV